MSLSSTRPIILFNGETGNDPDEEGSLVMLAGLMAMGEIKLGGVIVHRNPAQMRARVARGTLDQLGMSHVPVAIGANFGARQTNEDVQFDVPYISDEMDFPTGSDLFWQTLEGAPNSSVVFVCAGGMSDIAQYLREAEGQPRYINLLERKLRGVSMMGGADVDDRGNFVFDNDGYLTPWFAAVNNKHDEGASIYAFRTLQELGIPLAIISKHAAYAAASPRDCYDEFADTGHPVGIRLQAMQEALIQHLWHRCNLPGDDKEGREGLPCVPGKVGDPIWFGNVFCGGAENVEDLDGDDRIWEKIRVFNLYDQTAIMAAIKSVREEHFAPVRVKVGADDDYRVLVIGQTAKSHQVIDPQATVEYLLSTMLKGLE